MGDPVCLADYERLAEERLEEPWLGYFAGGAGDERTMADNVEAFGRLHLRPRVLRDVGDVSTRVTTLGLDLALGIRCHGGVDQPHADELLADGAGARDRLARLEVLHEGTDDGAEVDARVRPERLVLRGHLRVDHHLRKLGELDFAAILDGEGGEDLAIGRDDGRPLGEVEVLDLGDVGQVARQGGIRAQQEPEDREAGEAEGDQDEAREEG